MLIILADHFTFINSAMARGHVGDAILTVLFVPTKYDENPSLRAPLKGERVTLPSVDVDNFGATPSYRHSISVADSMQDTPTCCFNTTLF
jgi:hypothetical protein